VKKSEHVCFRIPFEKNDSAVEHIVGMTFLCAATHSVTHTFTRILTKVFN